MTEISDRPHRKRSCTVSLFHQTVLKMSRSTRWRFYRWKVPATNPNVEYLSEGITESIINTLSRIRQLRVLACSTVFRFKGKDIDPQTVGLQLNVRAVMMIRVIRLTRS